MKIKEIIYIIGKADNDILGNRIYFSYNNNTFSYAEYSLARNKIYGLITIEVIKYLYEQNLVIENLNSINISE